MPSDRARNKKREKAQKKPKRTGLLLAAGVGLLLLTLLLFLSAAVCLHSDLPEDKLPIFTYACCVLCAVITGFFAGHTMKSNGLLYGVLSVLPLCVLLMILCAALYGKLGVGMLIADSLIVLSGAIGGIFARNVRRKRRYR